MERIKIFCAGLIGAMAAHFKIYLPLIVLVALAVLLDFISGTGAALVTGEGWSSKIARRGVVKKGMLFLALGFGMFLDYALPLVAGQIGVQIAPHLLFSAVIGCYIAFTEIVSIAENIYKCTPEHFPLWMVKILKDGKEKLEEKLKGEDQDDQSAGER